MSDWNDQIIKEFRENEGKVGGMFAGASMLLLTTTGAKSGKRHTTPLVYFPNGERMIIVASAAGAPNHPAWYHNLVAHPKATIEVGTETYDVTAAIPPREERDQIWATVTKQNPGFAEYQTKTTRVIPVVALQR